MKFILFLAFLVALSIAPVANAATNIVQDDRAAVLSWDGGESPNSSLPTGVSGYRVDWGLSTAPKANSALTAHRIIEVQPLVNGTIYSATITPLDVLGNDMTPYSPVSFTGDSSRVDALRTSMTGFFDDFNLPSGPPDERKWNTAFSACDGPQSSFFINDQFHVHTMTTTADGNCDRGQVVVRPRAQFDFTGRTGTMVFDFDGSQRRDQWYLDLMSAPLDITGQVSIESGGTHYRPANMLRYHQNGSQLEVIMTDSTGMETSITHTDFNPFAPLDWAGVTLVPNVRRHWIITLSKTSTTITIDGVKVLTAPLSLPFEKATVLWNEFSYNTPKSNEPDVLGHWDNFGFDGPPTVPIRNYRATQYDTITRTSPTFTLNIPDTVGSGNLFYTLQMPTNSFYANSPNDSVSVNGTVIPLPRPTGGQDNDIVSVINPYSDFIPTAALHTGSNTITFNCSCGVLNVHAEFADGPYTPPPMLAMPPLVAPAPGASIGTVNGQWSGLAGRPSQNPQAIDVSGTFTLGLDATQDIGLNSVGKNRGITGVELFVDHVSVWKQALNTAPAYHQILSVNDGILNVSAGKHEFYFVAYDGDRISIPDYFDSDAVSGEYFPLTLNVIKPVTPTTTPLPPTTTAVPPTATSVPSTATPIVPTATIVPSTATTTPNTGVKICVPKKNFCETFTDITKDDVIIQ